MRITDTDVPCGVPDFQRLMADYEVLVAMEQTYDNYLNHVGYGHHPLRYACRNSAVGSA